MMNVLVVNGPVDERRAIVEALSQLEGVTVQCAMSDLATAASVLARYTPDVLVTGTELDDGDALQLVEKVRRRGMSIVVVGPAESREDWLRYLAAGADRFVEPDGELKELQDVMRDLIRQVGGAHRQAPPVAGRSASGLVHELNNYVHALEVLLELLERSPADKQLWTEARAAIEQAAWLMALVLGHVPDERPRAALVDFGVIVRSASATARDRIAPRCDVAVEVAGPLPRILGMASELERMVLELVLGTAEVMQDGGEVNVVVTRALDTVLLAVTTAGVDLREPRRPLELDVARAIVERHRGTLLVATCEPTSSSVLVMIPVPAPAS